MRARRLALAALLLAAPALAQGLDAAAFEAVRRRVVPAAPERWQELAWETDLLLARERAAREGRPLFLWAMNGHPLGCV